MASAADPLARYNAKRDFAKTAEPAGTLQPGHGNSFIVQKHDATRLHWDFRLEVDGVLKSWAVTRGPSLDPDEKRLAVRTEDHPLSYASFEGTIPKGQYGGGTVMLWDRGTWAPVAGKSASDIDKGHLHFVLDGERMKGEWLLIRLKPRDREKTENWLLRKLDDAAAGGTDTLVETALTSVATGRTMAEIAAGAPVPQPADPPRQTAQRRSGRKAGATVLPAFRDPQLCTLADVVPPGTGWVHEVKFDGYRAQIAVADGWARVFTRNGLDWTDKFPGVARAAAGLAGSGLIDGEIVAFNNGRPDFSTLKDVIAAGGEGLTLFAFDLLEQDGDDLTDQPLVERKARLQPWLKGADPTLQYAEHIVGGGEQLFAAMCREGYEGIVSKQADAPYRGTRSRAWLKIKCTHRQEFVVVGWSQSDKRRGFKSLLLGVREDGVLRYAGKVGTGFSAETIDDLRARLDRLERKTPPVEVPRAAARGARWVTPKLVAEIAFTEFTPDGVLRHPSFLGLREDKDAGDVVLETPTRSSDPPSGPVVEMPAVMVKVSNPERVIFPDAGITKGDLAAYYAAIAPLMLPWTADRPISLVRCPQGRAKHCFFQKHDAGSFGDHVHHVDIREKDGSTEAYLWVDDADGLVACVQMGTIELHGWGSRASDVERPDRMVFDLDPDIGLDFAEVRRAAADLKEHLADMGLASFPLLSGGKGVHVVVPLTPSAEWPAVKDFADRFARALAGAEPDRFTAALSKVKRKGRIFVDYLRNQRGATAIMPYSARAREGAPVAVPVTWSELGDLDTAAHWSVKDVRALVDHANARALSGWGVADQVLPDL